MVLNQSGVQICTRTKALGITSGSHTKSPYKFAKWFSAGCSSGWFLKKMIKFWVARSAWKQLNFLLHQVLTYRSIRIPARLLTGFWTGSYVSHQSDQNLPFGPPHTVRVVTKNARWIALRNFAATYSTCIKSDLFYSTDLFSRQRSPHFTVYSRSTVL